MSATILSRSRGSIVRCNGCGATSTTGQTAKKLHREYLRANGWGRGSLRGTSKLPSTKRHDLCPPCLKQDREEFKRRAIARESQIAERDKARRERAAAKKAA